MSEVKFLEVELIDIIEVDLGVEKYDAGIMCEQLTIGRKEFDTVTLNTELDEKDQYESPILNFKNLKICKRILQKSGSKEEKEAIMILIKRFKNGEV